MTFRHAIWIRTPKTAGVSLQSALFDQLVPCSGTAHFETCPPADFVFPEGRIFCLAPDLPGEVQKFVNVHDEVWNTALRFAVVRNPYDRFVSGWKYLKRIRNRALRDVLEHLPQSGPEYTHLTLRQCDFLAPDGALLPLHLLRFEALQQDLDALCDRLEIPRRVLPRLNQTPAKDRPFQEYLDAESRAMIAGHYRADFELLGYEP